MKNEILENSSIFNLASEINQSKLSAYFKDDIVERMHFHKLCIEILNVCHDKGFSFSIEKNLYSQQCLELMKLSKWFSVTDDRVSLLTSIEIKILLLRDVAIKLIQERIEVDELSYFKSIFDTDSLNWQSILASIERGPTDIFVYEKVKTITQSSDFNYKDIEFADSDIIYGKFSSGSLIVSNYLLDRRLLITEPCDHLLVCLYFRSFKKSILLNKMLDVIIENKKIPKIPRLEIFKLIKHNLNGLNSVINYDKYFQPKIFPSHIFDNFYNLTRDSEVKASYWDKYVFIENEVQQK